jgi:hypothetical protein
MHNRKNLANDGTQAPWWLRRGFLFAGAGVVVIVVLLVFLLTTGDDAQVTAPQQPATSPAPGATGHPGPTDEGPTDVPTATPDGIRWEIFGGTGLAGVALPVSEAAGPRQITGSTATGYAHTPLGALLATSQIPVRKLMAPDWKAVVAQQVMPGPGRDAYQVARAQVTDTAVTPGQLGQLAGFKFVNYTPETATIQLVSRFANGGLQMTTITVAWSQGDWKEVLQPDGSDSPNAQNANNQTGYIQWGGV